MTKATEELYVQFVWTCDCGTELQVHGEHYIGLRAGSYFVTCPKCGKQHDLPTRSLRFFVHEGQVWNRVPEGILCDHCHDADRPLTESNSAHIVPTPQRDSEGNEITAANVHKECAQAWIEANTSMPERA